MSKPRLVLDTNVVLDLLHFDDPVTRPLRRALEDGRIVGMVSDATLEELRRVLAYPEFALDPARQAALFRRYQAMTMKVDLANASSAQHCKGTSTHCESTPSRGRMPRCSDPDDQKFLELAWAAAAQVLVSKDRALLKVRRRCLPDFQIVTPEAAARWLDAVPA